MKKFLACIVLLLGIRTLSPAAAAVDLPPFLHDQLDQEVLAPFLPQIMEEVAKEFAHQNDKRTRRDTREYGLSYFTMMEGNFTPKDIPHFFQDLGAAICRALGHEPQKFTNIILSVYEAGFHLEPHVDVHEGHPDAKKFYFGEKVYGIVIEADATGHLSFVRYEGTEHCPPLDLPVTCTLEEKAGTIYCLEGPYRRAPLLHTVSEVTKRRISITFRTVTRIE